MCASGISRNIPASHRSLLLDRASDISKWPGDRRIKAVVTQGRLRVTYDGQGGYACLRIHPDDDFDQRLIAIDRLIEHDIRIARIKASLMKGRMENRRRNVMEFLKSRYQEDFEMNQIEALVDTFSMKS